MREPSMANVVKSRTSEFHQGRAFQASPTVNSLKCPWGCNETIPLPAATLAPHLVIAAPDRTWCPRPRGISKTAWPRTPQNGTPKIRSLFTISSGRAARLRRRAKDIDVHAVWNIMSRDATLRRDALAVLAHRDGDVHFTQQLDPAVREAFSLHIAVDRK